MTTSLLNQIFTVPVDDKRIMVYAPLKHISFVGNNSLVKLLYDKCIEINNGNISDNIPSGNLFADLNKLGFFTPEPLPEDTYASSGVSYDSVILFLTNQCNLRCTYCYAHSGEYPVKMMKWETARSAIDFAFQNIFSKGMEECTLGFHGGGEPTLNWNVLRQSVEYALELSRKFNIKLILSGAFNACWSDSVREFFIKNFNEISISFDGVAEIQNSQRTYANGNGSFEDVCRTLQALDAAQISYGIRMTVTDASVNRLSESVEYICKNFHPVKIQAEPVFEQGRASGGESSVKDLTVFLQQFIKGHAIARNYGIELFYSGARPDIITTRFCLAACRALVVTTDGDITTCFESYGREHPLSEFFIVGEYNGNGRFNINKEKLNAYFNHTVNDNEHCTGCFCKWHCAGDCTIKTMKQNGETGYQTTERCYLNREITKYLLLDSIIQNGGIISIGDAHRSNL